MSEYNCPVCASSATRPYFRVRNSPPLQNVLYESETEAKAARTIDADFLVCETCLSLFNPRFAEAAYSDRYNNDQSRSAVYREHLQAVVHYLHSVLGRGTSVLEIGCGNGLVLQGLQETGHDVEGFDPAHAAGLPYVHAETWHPVDKRYDAVLFRHTLEGIADFEPLIRDAAQSLSDEGLLYVEFTNARRMAAAGETVTLYHECAQYFSETGLTSLLSRFGMHVVDLRQFFGGAITGLVARRQKVHVPREARFDVLANYDDVHIWGISGRSIHFLTCYASELRSVRFGVDVDPRKQGRYVPFSGQKILSPSECMARHPQAVIVLNENYAEEVAAMFPYAIVILTAKDFYV